MHEDITSNCPVKSPRMTHDNNTSLRHEVMFAVGFKIEPNLSTGRNTDTFFNYGVSNLSILIDAHTRHEYGGLHQYSILNVNARREDGMTYPTITPQARADIR
jgi:hypothetical protein